MQASDQTNERLHQEASAQYLQGKFAEALATWRQILATDPDDERAKEGVRLCELLTDDADGGAAATASARQATASPGGQAATPDEPAEAASIDLELSLDEPGEAIELEVPDDEIDRPAATAAEPAQTGEFDLGDISDSLELDHSMAASEVETATLGDSPEGATGGASEEPQFGEIVEGVIPRADPAGEIEIKAASELKKRVADLLVEADTAYRSGDTGAVRRILGRIFILDEANEDALRLMDKLDDGAPPLPERAAPVDAAVAVPEFAVEDGAADMFDVAESIPEVPIELDAAATAEPVDLGDLAFPVPDESSGDEDATEAEALELAAPVPVVEAEPDADMVLPDPEDDPADGMEDDFDGTSEADADTAVQRAPAAGRAAPSRPAAKKPKTMWIAIGAVAGLVAVAAVFFALKPRPTEDGAAPPPVAGTAETAPPTESAEPAEPASEPTITAVEPVPVLLERGEAALDAKNYAAAILAFDAVLKQLPDHLGAAQRMQVATEAYRKQEQVRKQWSSATELFRDGDYRPALQMFYRLPVDGEEERTRLERYKENAWYNMGLLALRTRQCRQAREHFEEAAEIDPHDAGVARALELCDVCEAGQSAYLLAANGMPLRGLND